MKHNHKIINNDNDGLLITAPKKDVLNLIHCLIIIIFDLQIQCSNEAKMKNIE